MGVDNSRGYRACVTTVSSSAYAGSNQPRDLILTVYGLYSRDHGGWLCVASLIRLLAALDVGGPAVRSAVSRLKRRSLLEPGRVNGTAGYGLSESARRILDEGDQRIFQRPHADAGEGWVLAVFSVPEAERTRRHVLRSRLGWLGFGTVSPGVWIAPAHVEGQVLAMLERDVLAPYVDLFRADYLPDGLPISHPHSAADRRRKVADWWDLDALQGRYDDFLAAYRPMLGRWRRRRRSDDAAAFTDHTRAVTAWRRLPFLDPGLPADLLPRGWPGARAADLFFDLHDLLAEPAARHVSSVISG